MVDVRGNVLWKAVSMGPIRGCLRGTRRARRRWHESGEDVRGYGKRPAYAPTGAAAKLQGRGQTDSS